MENENEYKIYNQEVNRLKNKYKENILFKKNELSESIPHSMLLSFDILQKIYSVEGSLGLACNKLNVYYNKKIWQESNFIESVFSRIMINKVQERKIFNPFYKKKINYIFWPYFIFKESKKFIQVKKIKENYKRDFYKSIVRQIINLPKVLEVNDISSINRFINNFIYLYQHTFIINIVFADCQRNLLKKIKDSDVNLLLGQNIKTIDKSWQAYIDKDLFKILNNWSFRVKYDLELYCDEYVKMHKCKNSRDNKIDLDKVLKDISVWQKVFYKTEIINLLYFKEMAQNAKHFFSYAFNKFRIYLYQLGKEMNLEIKKDICFLGIDEINKKMDYKVIKKLILERKKKYFALLNKKIGNKIYLKDLI